MGVPRIQGKSLAVGRLESTSRMSPSMVHAPEGYGSCPVCVCVCLCVCVCVCVCPQP